jgi:desulfoferrodoxin (superoxide reductase-like protein)
LRHDFKEGDAVAEATFMVDPGIAVSAREDCNLHGLWAA